MLAAVLIGSFGFQAVWAGHFQPLLICLLVYALPTRWGAVAIGVAASLKATPLILAIQYVGRREWCNLAVAVSVAIALWAPALLLGFSFSGNAIGQTLSLLGYSPIAWAVLAGLAAIGAWRLAPTRFGWFGAAIAWIALLPRIQLYDVTGLLVAARTSPRHAPQARRAGGATRMSQIPVIAPARAAVPIEGRVSAVSSDPTGRR
jgi:hypothetical protein